MFGLFRKKAQETGSREQVPASKGGIRTDAQAWRLFSDRIQSEFQVPASGPGYPGYHGFLAFHFLDGAITRTRIQVTPADLFEPGRRDYGSLGLNMVEITGSFVGQGNVDFGDDLALIPAFDPNLGWDVAFDTAQAVFANDRYDVTSETLLAKIIASENVKLSLGTRHREDSLRTVKRHLYRVPVTHIAGLRLLIGDGLGQAYLEKLLRRNGYTPAG